MNDVGGADAQRGDEDAFQDAVRVAFEQMAVFVDAGLAFFGIHQQEFLVGLGVARGLPLGAERESRRRRGRAGLSR